MTTTLARFALGTAAVLLLLPGSLCAAEDPEKSIVPPVAHAEGPSDKVSHVLSICVAESPAAFEVNATLLFLRPSTGNLAYAVRINPFPFLTPHWEEQTVRPDYSPAFNVGCCYHFCSGGDVQIDWTHFNAYDQTSAGVTVPYTLGLLDGPANIQSLAPPFLIGPPLPYSTATGVAHTTYDAINADAGLTVRAGNSAQFRFFGGLQGARISQSLSGSFRGSVDDQPASFFDVTRSVFTGVGPRLGMEAHYLAGNFDLLGDIAGAALIGTRSGRIDFTTSSSRTRVQGVPVNEQSLTAPDATPVVPCIDAKLGASYSLPAGRLGIFKCEAGYQAAAYIDAVTHFALTEVGNPMTGLDEGVKAVFLRTAHEVQSNFLVHGPYVKFSWNF